MLWIVMLWVTITTATWCRDDRIVCRDPTDCCSGSCQHGLCYGPSCLWDDRLSGMSFDCCSSTATAGVCVSPVRSGVTCGRTTCFAWELCTETLQCVSGLPASDPILTSTMNASDLVLTLTVASLHDCPVTRATWWIDVSSRLTRIWNYTTTGTDDQATYIIDEPRDQEVFHVQLQLRCEMWSSSVMDYDVMANQTLVSRMTTDATFGSTDMEFYFGFLGFVFIVIALVGFLVPLKQWRQCMRSRSTHDDMPHYQRVSLQT